MLGNATLAKSIYLDGYHAPFVNSRKKLFVSNDTMRAPFGFRFSDSELDIRIMD